MIDDVSTIRVTTKTLDSDVLLEHMQSGILQMPRVRLTNDVYHTESSQIIEAIILRIPLPAIYIDATDEQWMIIDGADILITLEEYITDASFPLRALEALPDLEGCYFTDLPKHFQRRIREWRLLLHIVETGTEPAAVEYIKRLVKT